MNNIKEAMKLLEQVMTGPGIVPDRRDMVSSAHALLREFVETYDARDSDELWLAKEI